MSATAPARGPRDSDSVVVVEDHAGKFDCPTGHRPVVKAPRRRGLLLDVRTPRGGTILALRTQSVCVSILPSQHSHTSPCDLVAQRRISARDLFDRCREGPREGERREGKLDLLLCGDLPAHVVVIR